MAHQIENNYAFFAANTPAWHNIGHVLKDAPSILEAWKLAYPHELFKVDLEAVLGEARTPIESFKAVIRDDGKEIGHVGKDYELVQPYQAFDFFRPYLDSDLCTLEAGGSLNEGKRMWGLAKINGAETEIIKNDTVKSYLLVYTSFDGSLAHGIKFTNVRVVCANTLAQAIDTGKNSNASSFSFKHTKSIHSRINSAQATIKQAIESFQHSTQAFQQLAKHKQTHAEQVNYIKTVFEYSDNPDKENSPQLETKVLRVIDLIDTQANIDLVPAIRGTAWQSYNAVSQYLTHEAGRSDDTRVNSQWFGANAQLNQRALDLALAC